MEFRDTLLAAQRNQQQKSSVDNMYYKARFDPPKKEQKARDKLSANIQKFLAKKEEEERQKKEETLKKRDDLLAMRDPKALRKIQKTLKVIKSANKSVLADAINNDHTAVTLEGPDQPDQDDYGYESQSSAAIYEKMMQKYSKLPEEPKFSSGKSSSAKDINGTRERVKHALRHADDPVPHKRRRRTGKDDDRESSPPDKYEPEKKKDEKSEKPKIRKPAPPPMDFNQLLKLAEQKKSVPVEIASKKLASEPEPERPMTKKQRREYEEEMARRQRRQERLDAESNAIEKCKPGVRKGPKEEKPINRDKKPESILNGGRIPKLSDKNNVNKVDRNNELPKTSEKEKARQLDREKIERIQREKEKIKIEKDKLRIDKERLDRLKAERDRIDREMEKLNKDWEKLDKTKAKLESSRVSDKRIDKIVDRSKLNSKELAMKNNIDYKSQNAYRIDKNSNEGKPQKSDKLTNGHTSHSKPVPKVNKESENRNGIKDKGLQSKQKSLFGEGSQKVNGISKSDPKRVEVSKGLLQKRLEEKKSLSSSQKPLPSSSKPVANFDFDKHVNSLGKNGTKQFPPGNVKRKMNPNDIRKPKRPANYDSEYDSEMDDFIDDGDENMDYSTHIREIFGYDKSKYRDMDDDDDPTMESSFSRQQREEYISKKIGIMEDLEDMRMEAMEKNTKKKKRRRISDD